MVYIFFPHLIKQTPESHRCGFSNVFRMMKYWCSHSSVLQMCCPNHNISRSLLLTNRQMWTSLCNFSHSYRFGFHYTECHNDMLYVCIMHYSVMCRVVLSECSEGHAVYTGLWCEAKLSQHSLEHGQIHASCLSHIHTDIFHNLYILSYINNHFLHKNQCDTLLLNTQHN